MKSIPIASVATLATDSNGQDCIYVINEALWFGSTMENTLISSNQVRAFDVQLWDNPCDTNHDTYIHNTTSDHILPMDMDGIICLRRPVRPLSMR